MRVRAITAQTDGYGVRNPGEEFDLPDAEAVIRMRSGAVERVAQVPETAAINRGEKAVRHARA